MRSETINDDKALWHNKLIEKGTRNSLNLFGKQIIYLLKIDYIMLYYKTY